MESNKEREFCINKVINFLDTIGYNEKEARYLLGNIKVDESKKFNKLYLASKNEPSVIILDTNDSFLTIYMEVDNYTVTKKFVYFTRNDIVKTIGTMNTINTLIKNNYLY